MTSRSRLDRVLTQDLDAVRAAGRHRSLRPFTSLGEHATLDGQRRLVLCSNDYLGLAHHPRVRAAARAAIDEFGTGSTGSRLISGTTSLHEALEHDLAALKLQEAALTFGTGYQASLGCITAVVGSQDLVLSDERNHASLIDACRLSRANVRVYPHNDLDAAAKILREERAGYRRCLIATDGVFSMDGDLAPLQGLGELARDHDASLMVDDAHGTGVLGPHGSGTAAHLRAEEVELHMGTLSKALGSQGGFVAGSQLLREGLVNLSRPFIFSTALSPASVAAAREAVRIVRGEEGEALRARLRANAQALRAGLQELGFQVPDGETPIMPVILGGEADAMAAMRLLEASGLYVAAIRPPTVPPGSCRLRVTVKATHTADELQGALDAFRAMARALPATRHAAAPAVGNA